MASALVGLASSGLVAIHGWWDSVPYTVFMARWEHNAPERLAVAALELFAERG